MCAFYIKKRFDVYLLSVNNFQLEDKDMSEKMLVTQALDERDLLVKKINEKISKMEEMIKRACKMEDLMDY